MSTIAYIRVSTEEQSNEGVSLGMQGQKITQYSDFYDLDLQAIYWDPGVSGKSIEGRPGVQALLEDVKSGNVTDVIVYKLDRLGRNTIELLGIMESFRKEGVVFHSICEKIDTRTAMGKFFMRIIALLAEMERDIIVERTRAAMAAKKANGEKVSSLAPFGYKFDGNKVIEDPKEMRAMEIMHKLREDGLSLRKISTRLAKDGYLNRKGRPYDPSSVSAMLAL